MSFQFLKIPVPEFETARFALRAEARASEKKKRACAHAIVALQKAVKIMKARAFM